MNLGIGGTPLGSACERGYSAVQTVRAVGTAT